MNRYQLENNKLTLFVKPSPIFVRALMFMFSFMLFILPIGSMVSYISEGKGIHAGFFIGIFIFGLLGFYLLRISLWNTYGKEIIIFNGNKCTYYADYKWFKDGLKTEEFHNVIFAINPIGYADNNESSLIIEDDNSIIESVVKMSNEDIETLIRRLNSQFR